MNNFIETIAPWFFGLLFAGLMILLICGLSFSFYKEYYCFKNPTDFSCRMTTNNQIEVIK